MGACCSVVRPSSWNCPSSWHVQKLGCNKRSKLGMAVLLSIPEAGMIPGEGARNSVGMSA